MKQPVFVIVFAVLMLSACGDRGEEKSAAVTAPSTTASPGIPVASEQPMQSPVQEKVLEKIAPASTTAKPAATSEKTAKSSAGLKGVLSQEEGLELAKKSGCLACHKIETKLVGPAWHDVSKRYKGDADAKARLVEKVKKGGKGNWTAVTGGAAMPPNSPRVSDENIEKLVTFVLSL